MNSNSGAENFQPLQANDLDYIISHSTRSLVKAGNKKTLEFLGYSSEPEIEVEKFVLENNKIKIGNSLEFSFEIIFKKQENLIIDYKIYFIAKNGKLLPKIFKIKKVRPENFQTLQILKKHPLKLMSTKALFPGEHFVEIIINGKSFGKKSFILEM